jgi:hypothetical protein
MVLPLALARPLCLSASLTWWNWPASPTDVPESVPAAIAVDLTASSVALDETKLYNMDGLAPAETKVGRQVRQKS